MMCLSLSFCLFFTECLTKLSHETLHPEPLSAVLTSIQPVAAITVARNGTMELVSGDSLGWIAIWWLETKALVRKIKVKFVW